MNDDNKFELNKLSLIKIASIFLCCLLLILMVYNDYFLYDSTIAKIIKIDETICTTKENSVGTNNYKEKYYEQKIIAVVKNNEYKGEKILLINTYGESCVYDDKYSTGNDVFIEKIKNDNGILTSDISGKKRDQYIGIVVISLIGLLIILAGKKGFFVAASLTFNLLCFYYVLNLYAQGINLFILIIPMSILFSAITLYFIGGFSRLTFVSLTSTLLTAAIVTGISALILKFYNNVDYDFMDFLPHPYDQLNTNAIFISEILIGSLGAIMDVAITITATVNELIKVSPNITKKELALSCRRVGDDLLGSMMNVMFLTNVASGIPFFTLCLRNGIMLPTILKYHVFFEIARFLTGGIGVVLAIPVSGLLARYFLRRDISEC